MFAMPVTSAITAPIQQHLLLILALMSQLATSKSLRQESSTQVFVRSSTTVPQEVATVFRLYQATTLQVWLRHSKLTTHS